MGSSGAVYATAGNITTHEVDTTSVHGITNTAKIPFVVAQGTTATLAGPSSTVETDLWTYTVPGGSLAAGDRLWVWMAFDQINNTGGSATYLPKLYFGTTAILTGDTINIGQNANRRKGAAEFVLSCVDGTNQKASGTMDVSAAGSATLVGSGSAVPGWRGAGTATETSATDKTFKFSMTLGTSDAAIDFRMSSYLIVKYPAP